MVEKPAQVCRGDRIVSHDFPAFPEKLAEGREKMGLPQAAGAHEYSILLALDEGRGREFPKSLLDQSTLEPVEQIA